MNEVMDDRDRELLRVLQEGLPLTNRPYREVADDLGWTEDEVLSRLDAMFSSGTLRKFGAVLSPKKIGYVSTLAAVDVPAEEILETAGKINSFTGVTHNYLREGTPNIWFTLTEKDEATLECNLGKIEELIGRKVMKLPATQTFKIGVKLDI
jgi:DNA-binding Lrp family transcriptional regulator